MGLLGCGALLAWATALSFFDIRERRLPNALTLSGATVLLVVAVGTGHGATALAVRWRCPGCISSSTSRHRQRWAPVTSN